MFNLKKVTSLPWVHRECKVKPVLGLNGMYYELCILALVFLTYLTVVRYMLKLLFKKLLLKYR